MIINIRGTNGSGKSTLVRTLLGIADRGALEGARAREVPIVGFTTPDGKPRSISGLEAPERGLIAVGSYRNECGGSDGIKTQDLVCEAVTAAAGKARHVLFEGVIVSTLFSRYLALSARLGGMVWAYLDTPVEVCLERIATRNGGKAIKEDLVRNKIKAIESTRRKAVAAGEHVVILDYRNAVAQVEDMLR